MIQCGELCSSCLTQCNKDYADGHSLIQCVRCEGMDRDCEACQGEGTTAVVECPMKYVGSDMIDAANLASMCKQGVYPVNGGLLDQSAWFISFLQRLRSETNTIEAERIKNNG